MAGARSRKSGESVNLSVPAARDDWVEWLLKAFLTTALRRRVRWHRYKHDFQRHLRPSDAFLIGHPKSGNTWLAYMLAILLFKDRANQVTLANVGNYVPYIHGRDLQIAAWSNLQGPRVFRNEEPIYAQFYPKIIYLIRDPRAVLVSFYDMYQVVLNDRRTDFQSFLDQYIAADGIFRKWNRGLVRWDRQVLSWTRRAESDPRVVLVKFEDMVADRRGVLEQVARCLGISYAREELDCAVARGSFEAMRKNEDEFGAEAYPGVIGARGRFVRRGEIAGWKNDLSAEAVHRIEDAFAPAMRASGYLP